MERRRARGGAGRRRERSAAERAGLRSAACSWSAGRPRWGRLCGRGAAAVGPRARAPEAAPLPELSGPGPRRSAGGGRRRPGEKGLRCRDAAAVAGRGAGAALKPRLAVAGAAGAAQERPRLASSGTGEPFARAPSAGSDGGATEGRGGELRARFFTRCCFLISARLFSSGVLILKRKM